MTAGRPSRHARQIACVAGCTFSRSRPSLSPEPAPRRREPCGLVRPGPAFPYSHHGRLRSLAYLRQRRRYLCRLREACSTPCFISTPPHTMAPATLIPTSATAVGPVTLDRWGPKAAGDRVAAPTKPAPSRWTARRHRVAVHPEYRATTCRRAPYDGEGARSNGKRASCGGAAREGSLLPTAANHRVGPRCAPRYRGADCPASSEPLRSGRPGADLNLALEQSRQLRARAASQFAVGVGQVHLDRLDRHEQRLGDLLIAQAARSEAGDAQLTRG